MKTRFHIFVAFNVQFQNLNTSHTRRYKYLKSKSYRKHNDLANKHFICPKAIPGCKVDELIAIEQQRKETNDELFMYPNGG